MTETIATKATTPRLVRHHFPGLEGLRGVAALMVVFAHAAFIAGDERSGVFADPARFGDIGVSVFFVLSGFLIARPYIAAHLGGTKPAPVHVYFWRRILRIVPAYWAALLFFWGMYRIQPFGFKMGFELGPQWWKYFLLLQIYVPGLGQGGIAQSWSVATEVSFYLLIPLWAYVVRRLARGRSASISLVSASVAFLFVFGYVSRWWFSHYSGLAVKSSALIPGGVTVRAISFTWLPNQIDVFALGMAIAVLHTWAARTGKLDAVGRWCRHPSLWWLVALGLYGVVVWGLGQSPPGGYRSAYWQIRMALYGAIGAILLFPLVFGDPKVGLVRRFVNWKPVWFMGTVSYAVYLWHVDIMERLVTMPTGVGLRVEWHGIFDWRLANANFAGMFFLGWGLAFVAAVLSWYLLEKPIMRFKNLVGNRSARPVTEPVSDEPEPTPDSK